MIRIELLPKVDHRASGETKYRGMGAWLGDIELASGRGAVCCQAARRLVALGHDPGERVEFWNGGLLSLSGPVAAFAKLTVREDDGPAHFVPYVPGPSERVRAAACGAPSVRSIEVPATPIAPAHQISPDAPMPGLAA